jgi:hypothetical protein
LPNARPAITAAFQVEDSLLNASAAFANWAPPGRWPTGGVLNLGDAQPCTSGPSIRPVVPAASGRQQFG